MNWGLALQSLETALSRTLEMLTAQPSQGSEEIQQCFLSTAHSIIEVIAARHPASASDTAPHVTDWEITFNLLRQYLSRDLQFTSARSRKISRDISNQFEEMVKELRTLASKHAGRNWSEIAPLWSNLSSHTEMVSKQIRVQLGDAQEQTIYYFSKPNRANLRWLYKIRLNPPKDRSGTFDAVLDRTIAEVKFRIRIEAILAGSAERACRTCRRLCDKAAIQQEQTVPSLTSGLNCLLDSSFVRELVEVLKDDDRVRRDCIVEALALWFGEEAIGLIFHLVDMSGNPTEKMGYIALLATIGGCQATRILCDVLDDPLLRDIALSVLDKLASTPTAYVRTEEDEEDVRVEETVNLVLSRLTQLKNDGLTDGQLTVVEAKVRAYQRPM